ncbi:MAG: usg protein [Parvularculaceae bacterium]
MRKLSALEMKIEGYRLATAEILYHMPDHPKLLQSYIWQEYDLAPEYPVLRKFLDFWSRNLDGKLHSVTVAGRALFGPQDATFADAMLSMH